MVSPDLGSLFLSCTFYIPGSKTKGTGSVTIFIRSPVLEVRTDKYDPLILKVEPTDTIEKIHTLIEELTGYPSLQQRLIYEGEQLGRADTLFGVGIESGTFVYMALSCTGD